MSPPPPRARRRRRLRRTIPASDCSFTFAFAVFASVLARVVGLFWRALAWGRAGVLVTAHAVVVVGWARARWWVRCSRVCGGFGARADVCLASVFARVVGLVRRALACLLLFLLRCLRARWVRSARAGVGRGGRLVTARAVVVVV